MKFNLVSIVNSKLNEPNKMIVLTMFFNTIKIINLKKIKYLKFYQTENLLRTEIENKCIT